MTDGRAREALCTPPNPAGRYLADPFPIEVDGHHFIFVEDYSHAARRGAISVFEAGHTVRVVAAAKGARMRASPLRPVRVRAQRLEHMLPETGEAGRIVLHRAVEFPQYVAP